MVTRSRMPPCLRVMPLFCTLCRRGIREKLNRHAKIERLRYPLQRAERHVRVGRLEQRDLLPSNADAASQVRLG